MTYFERIAELEPENADRWLDAALRLNPRLARDWIARGLAAEREQNFDAAEHYLLEAAHIDKRYLPAWTLANFYFRRTRNDRFWKWARPAAILAYDDLRPLLDLAHAIDPILPPSRMAGRRLRF